MLAHRERRRLEHERREHQPLAHREVAVALLHPAAGLRQVDGRGQVVVRDLPLRAGHEPADGLAHAVVAVTRPAGRGGWRLGHRPGRSSGRGPHAGSGAGEVASRAAARRTSSASMTPSTTTVDRSTPSSRASRRAYGVTGLREGSGVAVGASAATLGLSATATGVCADAAAARWTSLRVILPCAPVPVTLARSTPSSAASVRMRGVTGCSGGLGRSGGSGGTACSGGSGVTAVSGGAGVLRGRRSGPAACRRAPSSPRRPAAR